MKPETQKDWKEALDGAITSYHADDLNVWELHLIGTRVQAALDDNGPTKSEMRKLQRKIAEQTTDIRQLLGASRRPYNCTCGVQ